MSPTNPLSVDELTLLEFFGEFPTQLDSELRWAYHDSTYEAVQGLAHVSFSIAPSVKDVRILLTIGEMRFTNSMPVVSKMAHTTIRKDANRWKWQLRLGTRSGSA